MARMIVARVVVAVLIGLAFGYAIGRSTAADAARGRELTVKEYIADFESHKKELIGSGVPMAAAVIIGMMRLEADTLRGTPFQLPLSCDTCWVAFPLASVDSIRIGSEEGNGLLWVAGVAGVLLAIASILHGVADGGT